MSLYWLFLIIPMALLILLVLIYFFNLDMKLVSIIYKYLNKRFDNEKRETSL